MQPRLKTSTKWTQIPEELATQILEVVNETFKNPAKVGRFKIEGRIYKSEMLLRIGYLENGRLAQANAEVSIEYNFKKETAQSILGMAVDVAGSLMDSYFQNPDDDFPREWKPFVIEQKEVFLKFTTVNSDLEDEADKLLGIEKSDDMVQGFGDDDVDAIKAQLGLDEDSDDDSSGTTH